MNQLNMMYYWEKVRLMFIDETPTIGQVQKLMSRCLKLYLKIDAFIKIFKLIQMKEVSTSLYFTKTILFNHFPYCVQKQDAKGKKDPILIKRLYTQIKCLLKENPILPYAFNYKGSCLLEILIREQKELGLQL